MRSLVSSIYVSKLRKRFGSYDAIKGADLEVMEGEFVTLLGESGCGKTTTLRCIAGLETPTSGQIIIGYDTVYDSEGKVEVPPERRNTGMVFQSYALWPHMTVLETVLYPLRRRKVAKAPAIRRAYEALEMLGLQELARRPATSLSGGQQQRVALARALVSRPRVMLYDEPLSNLDPSLRRQVRDELRRAHELRGTTSIYVTHDLEEAMHLSDRIVVMQSGLLEQSGTPAEIFTKPTNEFVARFVGFENILRGSVTSVSEKNVDVSIESIKGTLTLPLSAATGPLSVGDETLLAFRSANGT